MANLVKIQNLLFNAFAFGSWEDVKDSFLVFVIGMIVVMLVLGLLVLILIGIKYLLAWMQNRSSRRKETNDDNPAPECALESVPLEEQELAAVITAAVSMIYLEQQGEVPPFRIRNIRSNRRP